MHCSRLCTDMLQIYFWTHGILKFRYILYFFLYYKILPIILS